MHLSYLVFFTRRYKCCWSNFMHDFLCLIFFSQSHSLRCTESFMRENVVEELGQMQPDDETKHKMLDILKRFHSEEDMDSMDEDGMVYLLPRCHFACFFFFLRDLFSVCKNNFALGYCS